MTLNQSKWVICINWRAILQQAISIFNPTGGLNVTVVFFIKTELNDDQKIELIESGLQNNLEAAFTNPVKVCIAV